MKQSDFKTTSNKKCCGNCAYYMSDEDEDGNVTDFHHDGNKIDGFCAMHELFYTVTNNDKACTDWVHDGLTPQ